MWLGRFVGEPYNVPAYGADMYADFAELARERDVTDTRILDWAGKLSPAWLAGTLEYRRSSDGGLREMPAWIAATHLFQHAAHHRGQATRSSCRRVTTSASRTCRPAGDYSHT